MSDKVDDLYYSKIRAEVATSELAYWRHILDEYRKERKERKTIVDIDVINDAIQIAKAEISWIIKNGASAKEA